MTAELDRALARRDVDGAPGRARARVLAGGEGWTVSDVVCTSGPRDRPFEERHSRTSIALVAAGSFQYRSASGRALMTPGSLMLGSAGQSFECGHEHGAGDRCLSFWYGSQEFERLAADAGWRGAWTGFRALRLPPSRPLASLVARALAGLAGAVDVPWEELSLRLAAHVVTIVQGLSPEGSDPAPSAVARVTRAVRMIERDPDGPLRLSALAREARLSPFHFLRTFRRLTGLTPHQYVVRARLRSAAVQLATEPAKVLDVALDCGFGDVSNFNRAFRTELGVSPRAFRRGAAPSA
ncbi:MAG TPA: AraC family transcriptional regulator [Vicinamibacteria bacterium]|nr:AraC family transcriptional regulator [Vicinamibacteria bacterium]